MLLVDKGSTIIISGACIIISGCAFYEYITLVTNQFVRVKVKGHNNKWTPNGTYIVMTKNWDSLCQGYQKAQVPTMVYIPRNPDSERILFVKVVPRLSCEWELFDKKFTLCMFHSIPNSKLDSEHPFIPLFLMCSISCLFVFFLSIVNVLVPSI